MTDSRDQRASICNIIPELPDGFIETDAFKAIYKQLTELLDQPDNKSKSCFILITGVAGIGKTTLSMALLAKHLQSNESAVSWVIRCDKQEHLIKDLSILAEKLDSTYKNKKVDIRFTLDGTIKIQVLAADSLASRTIRHCKVSGASIRVEETNFMDEMLGIIGENLLFRAHWMILLDNVELGNAENALISVWFKSLLEVLRKCIPGIIVITSRNRGFLNYLKNSSDIMMIEADLEDAAYQVSHQQAAEMFFGTHDFANIVDVHGSEAELKDLVERLSFLPLAIKIAGIYVREENIKYTEYRHLLKNEAYDIDEIHKIMLQDSSPFVDAKCDSSGSGESVIITQRSAINMSVKRILQITEEHDKRNLLLLLNFCAFVDSDSIPVGLIKRFAKKLTKRKVLYVDFKNKMTRYSLIRLVSLESLAIHREVHWVLKAFCFRHGKEAKYKEAIVSLSLETFDNYLTSLPMIMPHIASFYGNCHKIVLDSALHHLLRQSSTKFDGHLNANIQKRSEATAEQLEHQWAQPVLQDESFEHQHDNEIRSKAQLAAAQASSSFQLPPQNDRFVGREMLLEELDTQLIRSRESNLGMTTVIVGPGGIGKSALAVAYIHRLLNKGLYQRTIWLYAEFSHQLLMQIQSLVKQWYTLEVEDMRSFNESDFVRLFYKFLTDESNGNTSIIFDNAGVLSATERYLPQRNVQTRNIDCLITTRDVKWATKFHQTAIKVEQFSPSEVEKYFQINLPLIETTCVEIKKLTDMLGGLPLAIVQAAAYVKQNGLNISAYIQLCEKQPILFTKSDDKNMLTVQHTLTLAIDKVRKVCSAVDPVVSTCAYLSTDHITKKLLYSILDKFNELEMRILNLFHGLDPTKVLQVLKRLKLTLQRSINTKKTSKDKLCDENNVHFNSTACPELNDQNTLKIIPQVQQANANNVGQGLLGSTLYLSKPACRTEIQYGVQIMADNISQIQCITDDDSVTQGQLDGTDFTLLRQVQEAVQRMAKNSDEQTVMSVLTDLENKFNGSHLSQIQRKHIASRESVNEALSLLEQYCIVSLQAGNVQIHRLTQAVMRNIHKKSALYHATYNQVLECLLQQLDYDEQDRNDVNRVSAIIPHTFYLQELEHEFLLKESPIKVAQFSSKIADHQLFGLRNPLVAVKCYKKTLQIEKKQYGISHSAVGATLGNLGIAYGELGNYKKQRDLLTRALAICEPQFGSDHPQTSIILTNLGNAYGSLGDYEKQKDLLTRALVIKEAQFGPNHSQTSNTLTNLSNAYGDLGDYKKQRDLLNRALVIEELHFGPDHPQTAITLSSLGNVYGDLGHYKQQQKLTTRALAIFEAQYGPDHLQTGITLTNLGNAYGSLGNYEKKCDLLTRALAIKEAQFGPNHLETSSALINLGNAYGSLGDYQKQLCLLTRALTIREAQFGSDHPQTAITLGSLGSAYGLLGNYTKQRDLLTRALAIYEEQFGPNHSQTAIALNSLGNAYGLLGDYEKQRDLLHRALAIREVQFGPNHLQTSITLTNLGNAYGSLGDYEKQRGLLTRAVAIYETQFDPDNSQTAIALNSLGNAYGSVGNYEKQRNLLTRALAIDEAKLGTNHPQTGITLTNLSNAYGLLGDYQTQRDLLIRALCIFEAQFGPDHAQTSIVLTNLGIAYGELGDNTKKRDLLTRALTIKEAQFGPDHLQTSITLTNLGNAYGSLGNYEKQRDLLTRALAIFQAKYDPDHPHTAITLTNLGNAYGSLGDYEKQRDLLNRALVILEAKFGPDHPQIAITLGSLGNAYGDLGNYTKKRDLLARALAIDEAQFGPNHPHTSATRVNLGNAYGLLGNYEKQRDLLTHALVIFEAQFGRNHPQTGITLTNLGNAYGSLGDHEKQRDLLTRALTIFEEQFGPDHSQTAIALGSLGNAYGSLGNYEKQRDLLTRALAIKEAQFGSDHPETSSTLTNLSNAYFLLGDYEMQRDLLTRALAICEKQFGPEHSETAIAMHNLSEACFKLGDMSLALHFANASLMIFRLCFGELHPYSRKALNQVRKMQSVETFR